MNSTAGGSAAASADHGGGSGDVSGVGGTDLDEDDTCWAEAVTRRLVRPPESSPPLEPLATPSVSTSTTAPLNEAPFQALSSAFATVGLALRKNDGTCEHCGESHHGDEDAVLSCAAKKMAAERGLTGRKALVQSAMGAAPTNQEKTELLLACATSLGWRKASRLSTKVLKRRTKDVLKLLCVLSGVPPEAVSCGISSPVLSSARFAKTLTGDRNLGKAVSLALRPQARQDLASPFGRQPSVVSSAWGTPQPKVLSAPWYSKPSGSSDPKGPPERHAVADQVVTTNPDLLAVLIALFEAVPTLASQAAQATGNDEAAAGRVLRELEGPLRQDFALLKCLSNMAWRRWYLFHMMVNSKFRRFDVAPCPSPAEAPQELKLIGEMGKLAVAVNCVDDKSASVTMDLAHTIGVRLGHEPYFRLMKEDWVRASRDASPGFRKSIVRIAILGDGYELFRAKANGRYLFVLTVDILSLGPGTPQVLNTNVVTLCNQNDSASAINHRKLRAPETRTRA